MIYDNTQRRLTPLARLLQQRIRERGPMEVSAFIHTCLLDPEFGYYRRQPAIGRSADFVTAPEISQVFGELLGLWTAAVWLQIGAPSTIDLVELGPGRGTLMADAIRAMRTVPGLRPALRVHLVETNSTLQEVQKEQMRIQEVEALHWPDLQAFAEGSQKKQDPILLIANEFLDSLGVQQFVAINGAWHKRTIELDAKGRLQFGIAQEATVPSETAPRPCNDGATYEECPAISEAIIPALRTLGARGPMAALFIDYGFVNGEHGDTLQAVRKHASEHPLTSPGEADLTAHVDFNAVSATAHQANLIVDGPTTQAEFLGRLGIVERTSRLMSSNPDRAGELEIATHRLIAPNGMGTRFKVVGLRNTRCPPLPALSLSH
ncbi:MAG: class I SAM-dependent methyltransferase [Hyphomicrobiaceae bacterium]